jgi:hypothetical protein
VEPIPGPERSATRNSGPLAGHYPGDEQVRRALDDPRTARYQQPPTARHEHYASLNVHATSRLTPEPRWTGQLRLPGEPVLAAHHRVVGAGRKYLVHGDETLRDRVDEVAGSGPPRGDRLGNDLGDVLGGGAEAAISPAWVLANEAPTAALYAA